VKLRAWTIGYWPQREWIERRGILVWLAEVSTSLGAGLYLASLYFDSLIGLLVGWLIIVVLKIPLHLAFFGKPLRFWRTVPPFTDRWKTSWFTRGIIFTMLFSGFGLLQLIFSFLLPGSVLDISFKVLAGIFAFLVGIYSGLIMNRVKAIPFWNSALLPVLLITSAVLYGFALLLILGLIGADINIQALKPIILTLLVINAFFLAIYVLGATYMGPAGQEAVNRLNHFPTAAIFWVGLVTLGIILPFAVSVAGYLVENISPALLILGVAGRMVGAFSLMYCWLKVGIYRPLLESVAP